MTGRQGYIGLDHPAYQDAIIKLRHHRRLKKFCEQVLSQTGHSMRSDSWWIWPLRDIWIRIYVNSKYKQAQEAVDEDFQNLEGEHGQHILQRCVVFDAWEFWGNHIRTEMIVSYIFDNLAMRNPKFQVRSKREPRLILVRYVLICYHLNCNISNYHICPRQ